MWISLWGAKIIYTYDSALQLMFRQLSDKSIPLERISFTNLQASFKRVHNDIYSCRIASIILPSCIVDSKPKDNRKKQKSGDDAKAPPKKQKKEAPIPPTANTPQPAILPEPVKNPKFNDQWKVDADKFRELHLIAKTTPTHLQNGKSTPFCLAFHSRGVCKRGKACTLSHDDPRDVDKEAEFTKFLKPFLAE